MKTFLQHFITIFVISVGMYDMTFETDKTLETNQTIITKTVFTLYKYGEGKIGMKENEIALNIFTSSLFGPYMVYKEAILLDGSKKRKINKAKNINMVEIWIHCIKLILIIWLVILLLFGRAHFFEFIHYLVSIIEGTKKQGK